MLGVANITNECVFMCMLCVLCGVLARTSVSVCVSVCFLQYLILTLTHLILFFAFLYPRNLLPGHITKLYLALSHSIVHVEVNTHLSQDDHKFILNHNCLCHLPALVDARVYTLG